jgi:hypothetical protein
MILVREDRENESFKRSNSPTFSPSIVIENIPPSVAWQDVKDFVRTVVQYVKN